MKISSRIDKQRYLYFFPKNRTFVQFVDTCQSYTSYAFIQNQAAAEKRQYRLGARQLSADVNYRLNNSQSIAFNPFQTNK